MFRIQAGAHRVHSQFFFAKRKIGRYRYIYIYVTKSEKLFTALAIHCPSSQFHLAQDTYYPILLLQDRHKIANLSPGCVTRILLDSRMWKRLAQSKKCGKSAKSS